MVEEREKDKGDAKRGEEEKGKGIGKRHFAIEFWRRRSTLGVEEE